MDRRPSTRLNASLLSIGLLCIVFAYQNCAPPFAPMGKSDLGSIKPFVTNPSFVSKCKPSSTAPKVQMHRLSNKEYANVINDLFSRPVAVTSFPLADELGSSGFSNDYMRMNNPAYQASDVLAKYFLLGIEIADDVMTNTPNKVLGLACTQNTNECNDDLIKKLALKLFRRPLGSVAGDISVEDYRALITSATSRKNGVELVLSTMLGSPSFVYKTYGTFAGGSEQAVSLNRYEIASRLSFFLWASTPDQVLLDSDLSNESVLDAQIDRMLLDDKANRLATVFGSEWTKYSDVTLSPISSDFGLSDTISTDAASESREFLNHVLRESPRLLDVINADYSYLNEDMSKFYGISGVIGNQFRLVKTPGEQRGGLITHMSLLSPTSSGDNDSHPVRRGLWVANDMMCIEIGNAPDGVDTTLENVVAKTPRELATNHSANPACMGCHRTLDPIGLGLENYDAVGQWRTSYTISARWAGKNISVDSDGELMGKKFSGPAQLKEMVAQDPRTHACIAGKIMRYAVGRNLASVDYCDSEKIGADVIGKQGSFKDVVKLIARSNAFTKGGR